MKRKLVLLNIALLALAAAAAWQVRAQWLDGKARERKVLREPVQAAEPPPATSLQPPQPARASAYIEVAQKMLFSQDRNPDVVVEAGPPKPMPPLPVAYGVMNLGGGPTVFLGEKPGAPNRGYSAGEKVGEFTLVALDQDEIVLEWDGQKFKKKLADLRPQAGVQPPGAPVAEAPRQASTQVQTVTVSQDLGPGPEAAPGAKFCEPGDTSPAGTVRDGYRKVVSPTPVGNACHWEQVK
jgi:hypothetical protein